MIEVRQTEQFTDWLKGLKDRTARVRISARLVRAETGNLGDVKPVGEGVSEMRLTYGPGYRLYFVQRGQTLIVMLGGGDKGTQGKDIKAAKALAAEV